LFFFSFLSSSYLHFLANREKVIEYELRSVLDGTVLTNLHPRTAINVVFQEIQNDGNVRIYVYQRLLELQNDNLICFNEKSIWHARSIAFA
jgi:hypothetical protein